MQPWGRDPDLALRGFGRVAGNNEEITSLMARGDGLSGFLAE